MSMSNSWWLASASYSHTTGLQTEELSKSMKRRPPPGYNSEDEAEAADDAGDDRIPAMASSAGGPAPAKRARAGAGDLIIGKAVKEEGEMAQPADAKSGIVPKVAMRWLFSGPSNSGKTNQARWVMDQHYNKKGGGSFFKRIHLFSPTADVDPVWKNLAGLAQQDRHTVLGDGSRLMEIFEKGIRQCKAVGKINCPPQLVIIDDAITDTKFLASPGFLKLFVAGRHANISVFAMTQSYVKLPRSVRLQATAISFFPSRPTEIERLYDEHGPVSMNKKQFMGMVMDAIAPTAADKFPFFFIDVNAPLACRYRKGLGECYAVSEK
jgi:hypothetical protein